MLAAAIEALRDPALIAPALLSLKIAAATLVLHIVLGTLLGWRWRSDRGRAAPWPTRW